MSHYTCENKECKKKFAEPVDNCCPHCKSLRWIYSIEFDQNYLSAVERQFMAAQSRLVNQFNPSDADFEIKT